MAHMLLNLLSIKTSEDPPEKARGFALFSEDNDVFASIQIPYSIENYLNWLMHR